MIGCRRDRPLPPATAGGVVDLSPARIQRALAVRRRYKYVQPRVEREGDGWKIVSPNCSRNIDPQGGEIAIAWLQPSASGTLWQLHSRDHVNQAWRLEAQGLTLADALYRLCDDPLGVYWP